MMPIIKPPKTTREKLSAAWDNVCRHCSMEWFRISMLLSGFGFVKEFRPSEPFVFEYLIGEWRNVTEEQVQQEVYPVGSYSYMAHLLVVFLITDMCRYKPLIVMLGVSGIIVYNILLWGPTLLWLQICQGFYGTFMATEVAYYTYIYAKVDSNHYQEVSSHTRAAILAGRALASVVGQVLISFEVMDYRQLNYLTFTAMIIATFWAFLLPNVSRTIYFHQTSNQRLTSPTKYRNAFKLMGRHFVESYKNRYVIKWSMWWALTTAGFIQVQYYMQPLWTQIQAENGGGEVYNGAVEAAATILGFLGALLAGYLKVDWQQKGELILSCCSITSASITLVSSQTQNVYISYACYVGFVAIYHFMITIASSEIARCIVEDSYGLIFGLNTFISLLVQNALTIGLVTGKIGLGLTPRNQFLSYGIYHVGIASLFVIIGLISWLKSSRDIKKTYN